MKSASAKSQKIGSKRVLSVALHPAVAETRSLMLQGAGFQVSTVSDLRDLREACQAHRHDLLLIGQGISAKEKIRIAAEFREHNQAAPMLEIFEISPDLESAEFRFQAVDGPEQLTKTVKQILDSL
jgi:DNA-binding NtrC family response regulator